VRGRGDEGWGRARERDSYTCAPMTCRRNGESERKCKGERERERRRDVIVSNFILWYVPYVSTYLLGSNQEKK